MSQTQETYLKPCSHCQASFDALAATWCSCLVPESTLVCPSCLRCFCAALPAYKAGFWSGAPRSLWERKFEEHHRAAELPPNPEPDAVMRPLVLVVDDERAIHRVAARAIASLGYGMVLGQNGQEGLELTRRYRPDLVLSDALMPRMDGREMCRMIKGDPETAGTKVVVMTSLYKAVKYRTEAHKVYKVDDYLAKPLAFQELRALLQRHLDTPVEVQLGA
ncbi:MAG TPA: response regulator [Vicinamibacteria bacterium]|nr:response regulator [Vicinamibacteria bacterium]